MYILYEVRCMVLYVVDIMIAVIIPAFNEALTINKVITAFYKAIPDAFFYIIDNNSTDATYKIAKKSLKSVNVNGIVVKEKRQGKGFAVSKAFLEVESDIYIY